MNPPKYDHRTSAESANATGLVAQQDTEDPTSALTLCELESLGYTVLALGDIPGLEGKFRWTNTHTFEFGVASDSEAEAWTHAAEAWGDKHDRNGFLSATHSGEITPAQLESHYSHGGANGGGQHPVFTRADWRHAVEDAQTVKGYWAWLASEISQGKRQSENGSPVQRHRGWLGAHH
jgi:hypothetical protein